MRTASIVKLRACYSAHVFVRSFGENVPELITADRLRIRCLSVVDLPRLLLARDPVADKRANFLHLSRRDEGFASLIM